MRFRRLLLRNTRKTGSESSAPPKGQTSSFPVWRRAAAPFALHFDRADFVLLLHFFRGFFESDLLSIRDQLATIFASVAALLASFGLIVPVLFNHKYRVLNALPTPALYHEAALADKLMFICLCMDLAAIATLLNWQSLFPDLTDFLVLIPLPLERLQLFRAKLVALLLFVTLLIVSVNVLPSFSLTAIMSGRWQQPSNSILQITSLFVACCLAGYFVFFSLLAIQAILLNVLPSVWFATCSLVMQGVLLVFTCAALPLTLWIPGLHSWIAAEPPTLHWLPPAWFLGLEESMLGISDSAMRQLANQAWWSLCLAVTLSVLLYVLTYARDTDQLLKSPVTKQSRFAGRCLSRILNMAIRVPEERAIVSFAVKSLFRSRVHKLLVAGIVGAALALVLDGFVSLLIDQALHHRVIRPYAVRSALSSAPLIVAYFLSSGMLFVFSIPIELQANWIFRLSEVQGRYWPISAAEKILLAVIVVPVSAITLLSLSIRMGFVEAFMQAVFVLLMCLVLMEGLLWNWSRIPFTCPYLPGRRNIIQSALLFGVALSVFAYVATSIELRLSNSLLAMAILFAALTTIFLFMQVQRRRSWTGGLWVRFDEQLEPEVQTLDLRGE
jgi:hypothetical protein